MGLGIGSYAYTWAVGVAGCPSPNVMDAEQLLAGAAALGVRVVQICGNLPLDGLPEEALAARFGVPAAYDEAEALLARDGSTSWI